MKKHLSNILLVLVLLAGLALLLYPTVANWWNSMLFRDAVSDYTVQISHADTSKTDAILEAANAYNKVVALRGNEFGIMDDESKAEYYAQLSIDGSTMMGYITIPTLNISFPIYHGTEEAVLSAGIGHVEGTSLPVGGADTHSVLSGHRGLPSARLFTDLDKVAVDDIFIIDTMGLTLTYQVDRITIVLPQDLDMVQIEPGEDLCTLVTCTPYGINTHRLLVRGHRVDNMKQPVRVTADALQIRPIMVAPFLAAPLLIIFLIFVFTAPQVNAGRNDEDTDEGGI